MSDAKMSQIIERYTAAAVAYGKSIQEGDAKVSDRCFERVERAFVELRAEGSEGLQAIAGLLDSSDESVRLWASSHLLNYPEFNSLPVLEKLTDSSSVLALTAEVTLDHWRNGRITY